MAQPFELKVITMYTTKKPFPVPEYMTALAALVLAKLVPAQPFPKWLLEGGREPHDAFTLLRDLRQILGILDEEGWNASAASPLLLELLAPRLLVPVGHTVEPDAFVRGVAEHGSLGIGGTVYALGESPDYALVDDAFVPLLAARTHELFITFLEALDDIAGAVTPELRLSKWPKRYPLLGAVLMLRDAALERDAQRLADLRPDELGIVTKALALDHSLQTVSAS